MELDGEPGLVKRSRAGDKAAFERLCRAVGDRAYGLAYRLTGSHADADDVLQEARLRAYRGIGKFDGRARFETWFYRIVLNAAATHLRRSARREGVHSLEVAGRPEQHESGSDPTLAAQARELESALQVALLGLPADQRSALVLVAFQGFSYASAAAVQGCPEGTLAWRVAEARRKLACRLAPFLQ